jgi:hypothetical protein
MTVLRAKPELLGKLSPGPAGLVVRQHLLHEPVVQAEVHPPDRRNLRSARVGLPGQRCQALCPFDLFRVVGVRSHMLDRQIASRSLLQSWPEARVLTTTAVPARVANPPGHSRTNLFIGRLSIEPLLPVNHS